jgi:hypothetical protein
MRKSYLVHKFLIINIVIVVSDKVSDSHSSATPFLAEGELCLHLIGRDSRGFLIAFSLHPILEASTSVT